MKAKKEPRRAVAMRNKPRLSPEEIVEQIVRATHVLPSITPPRRKLALGADAAMLWFGEQLRFVERMEDGRICAKWVEGQAVSAAFSRQPVVSPRLPVGTLHYGTGVGCTLIVRLHPAGPTALTLSVSGCVKPVRPTQKTRELIVQLPAMVSFARGDSLRVYALREDRIGARGALCQAPLPNVYGNGQVCWGANTHTDTFNLWELFIGTEFNGHLTERKSETFPDVREQLLAAVDRAYPVQDLVGTHETFQTILEDCTRRLGQVGGRNE